jgi:hypothetical protein
MRKDDRTQDASSPLGTEDIRQFQDATIEVVRTVTLNLNASTAYYSPKT